MINVIDALLILILFFSPLSAKSLFDGISDDEKAAAGLHKLSKKEKKALEKVLYKHSQYYFPRIPKTEDARDLNWIYEAKPINRNIPSDSYLESEMIYDIALCAIFQNEAPWLKEWIEYHKLIGVEHFYLYNNLSTDHYLNVLDPYIKAGEVELIEWPATRFFIDNQNVAQNQAYENALQRARGKAKWLVIIDTDEFVLPVSTYSLHDALKEFEPYGGITVNWQMFGTSKVKSIPKDKLMIEMLTRKHRSDFGGNWFVKSIVKPHRVERVGDPHFCYYINDYFPVDTSHLQPCLSQNHRIPLDKIQINHYWYRSEEYYFNYKVPRRILWEGKPRDPKKEAEEIAAANAEKDTKILKYVPDLKARFRNSR